MMAFNKIVSKQLTTERKVMSLPDSVISAVGGKADAKNGSKSIRGSHPRFSRSKQRSPRPDEQIMKTKKSKADENQMGRAEGVWNNALHRVRSFQDDSEQYVHENPTKAIFTALGVGFVLGLIFRR